VVASCLEIQVALALRWIAVEPFLAACHADSAPLAKASLLEACIVAVFARMQELRMASLHQASEEQSPQKHSHGLSEGPGPPRF